MSAAILWLVQVYIGYGFVWSSQSSGRGGRNMVGIARMLTCARLRFVVEPNSVSLLPLLSPLDCSHQIALCASIFYRVILDIFLINVVLCD